MLIANSTTGISHYYMGNKSGYAIKQSSSFRMASSVLRRQASWDVCKKDNARQTETIHSEWKIIHSWKGIMVRNRNRNVLHWLPPCPWNDFFIDLQRFTKEQCVSNSFNRTSNSRKQHTHVLFNCFTQQSNCSKTRPALASHQAAPQLTDAFKIMLLLWNGQLKCKMNVENNNRTTWFIARFADVMTKTED